MKLFFTIFILILTIFIFIRVIQIYQIGFVLEHLESLVYSILILNLLFPNSYKLISPKKCFYDSMSKKIAILLYLKYLSYKTALFFNSWIKDLKINVCTNLKINLFYFFYSITLLECNEIWDSYSSLSKVFWRGSGTDPSQILVKWACLLRS